MDSVNVNIGNRYKSSKKNSISDNVNVRVGDNLFSLMLVGIAAVGVWAISVVLFL